MANSAKQRLIEVHQPQWESIWIWLAFMGAFILAEGGLLWAVLAGLWWLALPLMLLVAHLMHAHLIAFHEAAHATLCPNRRCNDAVGILLGTLSLMGFSLHRAAH